MPSTSDAAPTIRRATADDAEAVRDLTRRAYGKWVAVLGREPQPMTADHLQAIRRNRVDVVMEVDRIVALVHTVDRPDDLLVENLAVDPDRQRRGLGDVLLGLAEAIAAASGKPAVRLYTNSLMAGNVGFYAARGYRVEGEEPFGAGTRVHMVKALSHMLAE